MGDTFSIPDPPNQISLGMWPRNLEGAKFSKDGNHRPYQGFANSGFWAKPSPQAVSVSPIILECGHTHFCVYCLWQPLPCLCRAWRHIPVWLMLLKHYLWFSVTEVLHPPIFFLGDLCIHSLF